MNTADLARLTLAKRAFQATQPGEAEVQTGVRRARLAISRTKPRRRWLSKGLVFVVLAVGSLAYAKPQALGELVEKVLPREPADAGKRLVRGPATEPAEAVAEAAAASTTEAVAAAQRESLAESASDNADAPTLKKAPAAAESPTAARPTAARPTAARSTAARPTAALSRPRTASGATDTTASAPSTAVSDWGRVGQALARGDDTAALAALNGLSESDDPRTRDKADLGRAQLLMAHGDPEKACALARSLTHRRAGGRIERQAQLLLKSCGR
jgi:hypothetical protein